MCEPASMIVIRGPKVHWSENTDSHEEIIAECNLREMDTRKAINIVPIEITPPNSDWNKPLAEWVFHVDYYGYRRDLPDWWNAEKCETACRAALKDWAKAKLVKGKRAEITSGQHYLVGNAEVGIVRDSAVIQYVRDSAVIQYVRDSAVIQDVRGSAVIKDVRDSAVIKDVRGSATIIVYTSVDPTCLKTKTAVMIDRSISSQIDVWVGGKKR